MQTALILMTILGCDDTGSQCHYIRTHQQRWTSIELCDAASEKELTRITDADYPMLVAVCQTPEPALAGSNIPAAEGGAGDATDLPATEENERQGLAARAMERIRGALPAVEDLKRLAGKPVRMVTDSYSWVARKVAD